MLWIISDQTSNDYATFFIDKVALENYLKQQESK